MRAGIDSEAVEVLKQWKYPVCKPLWRDRLLATVRRSIYKVLCLNVSIDRPRVCFFALGSRNREGN
ncbi:MAG: hypothetical protein ACBR20_20815 [Microcoleus sp.]